MVYRRGKDARARRRLFPQLTMGSRKPAEGKSKPLEGKSKPAEGKSKPGGRKIQVGFFRESNLFKAQRPIRVKKSKILLRAAGRPDIRPPPARDIIFSFSQARRQENVRKSSASSARRPCDFARRPRSTFFAGGRRGNRGKSRPAAEAAIPRGSRRVEPRSPPRAPDRVRSPCDRNATWRGPAPA